MVRFVSTVCTRVVAFLIIAIAAGGVTASCAAADVCWQSGITPEGHSYRVLYVPGEAVRIAASGKPHNYLAVAVAFPGWIWVDASLPCRIIPWQHEIKHLDGWVHDANGRWTGKTAVAFASGDGPRTPWTVVKIADDYRVVHNAELAALPDSAN